MITTPSNLLPKYCPKCWTSPVNKWVARASTAAKKMGASLSGRDSPRGSPRRSEERRVGKEWRSLCDWSSDVCSSDLTALALGVAFPHFEVLSRKHDHNPFEPAAEILSEVLDVARQQVGGTRFNRR